MGKTTESAEPIHRAPNGSPRTRTTVRLRDDLKLWLETRAERRGRTASAELEAILEATRSKGGR